jgi:hypothetical protein
MAPAVNSGWYDAMLQIAKSENMVDRLQLLNRSIAQWKKI